jgi:hypothetical protein
MYQSLENELTAITSQYEAGLMTEEESVNKKCGEILHTAYLLPMLNEGVPTEHADSIQAIIEMDTQVSILMDRIYGKDAPEEGCLTPIEEYCRLREVATSHELPPPPALIEVSNALEDSLIAKGKAIAFTASNVQTQISEYLIELVEAIATKNIRYTLLSEFNNSLGKGINKKGIRDWIVDSCPLKWVEDENKFIRIKSKKWDLSKLATAKALPYHEHAKVKKDSNPPVFNSSKKLEALNKAIEKLRGEFVGNGVDTSILDSLLAAF